MLDLARHIIETKRGRFNPATFDDRYEAAVAELVKAKLAGKPVKLAKPTKPPKKVDLMEALRASLGNQSATVKKPTAARKRTTKKAA